MICLVCAHSKTEGSDGFFEFCVWCWIPCRGDFCSSDLVLRVAESDPFKAKMWSANCGNTCKGVNEAEREIP